MKRETHNRKTDRPFAKSAAGKLRRAARKQKQAARWAIVEAKESRNEHAR
jgi:hypothetical protein